MNNQGIPPPTPLTGNQSGLPSDDNWRVKVRRAIRLAIFRLLGVAGAFLFVMVIMIGSAGWYTSRSEFCNSCHIMEPYYDSWKSSKHNQVACIECHFAPGFGGKIRGKMLGLVQLAKYVTKTAPPGFSAEIPDASCLRSGCHESRLLSGRVDFKGIAFDHSPHLEKMRRNIKLRCTSCHSQIVQGPHMEVTPSTCFLCHFEGEPFNAGLSTCTRCHQIPSRKFDLGGGVTFTHELAYEKGVDCVNCHRSVIRGGGKVPKGRCQMCHNRPGDLLQLGNEEYLHDKHVSEHKIDCSRCHSPMQHSLDTEKIARAASDCSGCHPDHHRRQIEMFSGVGAATSQKFVGSMQVIGIDCRTCHRTHEISPEGAVIFKGSLHVCSICHAASTVEKLESYHKQLQASLPEIQDGVDRAAKALASAKIVEDRKAGKATRRFKK
jgi:nitrate/TMAO reductase-like tetraheme cytochrome c subunit